MNNPFDSIEARLNNIENLLLDLKQTWSKSGSQSDAIELLTVQAAADFLFLKIQTVYGKIHRKELNVIKRGGRCYFLKSDLVAYLLSGRKKTSLELQQDAEIFLSGIKHK